MQRLDSESIVSVHKESISWILRHISRFDGIGNKKLRNSAIEFFSVVLGPLLVAVIEPAEAAEMCVPHLHRVPAD